MVDANHNQSYGGIQELTTEQVLGLANIIGIWKQYKRNHVDEINIEYAPCSQIKDSPVLEKILLKHTNLAVSSSILNHGFCPKMTQKQFDSYQVYGNSFHVGEYATFDVIVKPCYIQNSLCKAPFKDLQEGSKILVRTILPIKTFNPLDKNRPVQIYYEVTATESIDPQFEKISEIDLEQFEVYDSDYTTTLNLDYIQLSAVTNTVAARAFYNPNNRYDPKAVQCDLAYPFVC